MIKKISVGNTTIENIEPIRNSFKNKNNKFSAKGYILQNKVKIFEVFDKKQGQLFEFISKNNELSKYFPKLILYDDKYIVEEWIDGETLKEINNKNNMIATLSEEIKNVITLMWSLKYDTQVFDYLKYIHDRVNKDYNSDLKHLPLRINHNDLSLDNIMLTSKGLKIIDNEFLGCNNGWVLNFKNSFLEENFEYQNYISMEKLNALWRIRKDWSKIKSEKYNIKKWSLKNLIKKLI